MKTREKIVYDKEGRANKSATYSLRPGQDQAAQETKALFPTRPAANCAAPGTYYPNSFEPAHPETVVKPESLLPAHCLEPSKDDIQELARACHGGNFEPARHHLVWERINRASLIQRFRPQAWEPIRQAAEELDRLRDRIVGDLAPEAQVVIDLEQRLVELGDARRAVRDLEARMASSQAQLDDRSALDMAAEQVAKLTNDLKLLPGVIAETKARAEQLKAAVDNLAKDVDLPALLRWMYAKSGRQEGKSFIEDEHVHHLFDGGFIDFPR